MSIFFLIEMPPHIEIDKIQVQQNMDLLLGARQFVPICVGCILFSCITLMYGRQGSGFYQVSGTAQPLQVSISCPVKSKGPSKDLQSCAIFLPPILISFLYRLTSPSFALILSFFASTHLLLRQGVVLPPGLYPCHALFLDCSLFLSEKLLLHFPLICA